MSYYTVNEPHPTVPQNSYIHSGRGGAGNTFRVSQTTSPVGIPTKAQPAPQQSTRFYSGRGGAGNAHASSERPVMSFDDEYGSALAREQAHAAHVGRGGAGNVYSESKKDRKHSDASHRSSSSTHSSIRSGFWGRLSGASLGSH